VSSILRRLTVRKEASLVQQQLHLWLQEPVLLPYVTEQPLVLSMLVDSALNYDERTSCI
jgi:hypothetical protein